jgi:uncharacterized protein YhfF
VVTVTDPMPTFDGNPHSATATAVGIDGHTAVSGSFSFTYDGSGTAPTNAKTSYAVVATFTSTDPNYTGATGNGTLTIKQATPTVTVTDPMPTYDGNPHTASATAVGVDGHTAVNGSFSFTYDGSGTAPTNAKTSYAVVAMFTSTDPNYTGASGNGTLTIKQATPTVTVTDPMPTYDGNPHTASATAVGVDGHTAVSGSFTFTYDGSATAPTNAKTSYAVVATFTSTDPNYTGATGNGILTINKADSTTTVTVAGGESFTYDGNAHPATVSVTGAGGLSLTPAPVYSCGHAPIDVADSGCTASYSFAGDNNHNPSSDSKTYSITKAPSTTTVSGGGSFVFDGLTHAASVSVTGVGGLNLTPAPNYSGSCSAAPVHVADTPCTASYTFAGDADHFGSNGSTTITITKAPSTTTVSGGGTFVFDGLTHAASVSVTGVGGLNLTPAPNYSGSCSAAPVHVADTPCTASYTFAGDADHFGSNGSTTITITKAPATTTIGAGYTVTYDSLQHGVTASVTGAGGLNQSLPVTYTPPGDATVPVNAGTYTAAASYPGDADHTGSSAGPVTIIINKATPVFSNLASPTIVLATGSTILSGKLAAGALVPPGSVSITVNSVIQVAAINPADGTFSSTFATGAFPVSPGYSINYNYAGSMNFNMATGSGTLKVQYASGGICDGDAGHTILQPINADGSSVFKQGSTIPSKFRVCDANGMSIGTPSVITGFVLYQINSGVIAPVDESVDNSTNDLGWRFDPTGQQWIFNMSTKTAPQNIANRTYYYRISLNDGSTIMYNFGLK